MQQLNTTSATRPLPQPGGQQHQVVISPVQQEKEKFKYILTLAELEKASNEYIVALKEQEWMYSEVNSTGIQFAHDINRLTTVNDKTLRSHEVDEYAKQYPLINDYALFHAQHGMYLFSSSIIKNIDKANFDIGSFSIVGKNESTNVEVTEESACLKTDNNLLLIMNYNPGNRLFSIPGHIQTVFEMIKGYAPQLIYAEGPIPSDEIVKANAKKLYLYLNNEGLLEYAVYNENHGVKRIAVNDIELGEEIGARIKNELKQLSSAQMLDNETGKEALLAFFKVVSNAGYSVGGLKLKTIKTSNGVLRDLIVNRFEKFDEAILEGLVDKAKQEESPESLYIFYREQAKIFFSKRFSEMYDYLLKDGYKKFAEDFTKELHVFLNQDEIKRFMLDIDRFLKEGKEEEVREGGKSLPQKTVRLLPTPGYGLPFTLHCSEKYKFIFSLYIHMQKENGQKDFPQPAPEINLNKDGGLLITIPQEANKFKAVFETYNSRMDNSIFNFTDVSGNIIVMFKNYVELEKFLPDKMQSFVVKNLYKALCTENNFDFDTLWHLKDRHPNPVSSDFKDTLSQIVSRSHSPVNSHATCISPIDIFF